MMADEMTLHAEVYEQVSADVDERVNANPQDWWRVKDVAKMYCEYYCILQQGRTKIPQTAWTHY